MRAYLILYRWFADVSGMGLAKQARQLMHPDTVKREEGLLKSVDAWLDQLRRLEAHGDEYKLPPVHEINALKILLTGRSREYFDMWEADGDPLDSTKKYDGLLNRVKDEAGKRRIDGHVTKVIGTGGDPTGER